MWLKLAAIFSVVLLSSSRILDEGCTDTSVVPTPGFKPKTIVVTTTGIFESPGYNSKDKVYPDNVQCAYIFQAPGSMHVRIKFNDMDIDATDFCNSDSVELHDFGSDGRSRFVEKYCGKHIPNDYVSSGFAAMLILRSDDFGGRRGFNITYTPESSGDACKSDEMMCRNRKCVKKSGKCNGDDDCGDGTDEENCKAPWPTVPCGVSDIQPDTFAPFDRIVGGQAVKQGSWPWMADLQIGWAFPNSHICGGSLINAQWVATAAHCVGGFRRPSDFRIHLGNHKKYEKNEGEQVRYVERIVVYDDIPSNIFESNGKYDIVHDVALMKLNAPVKFTKYVKPVCLPTQLSSSSNCYAIGWGATRGSGSNSVLKQSKHPIQQGQECQRLVGNQFVPNTMICAGSLGKLQGVCHGDSGGPLLCKSNNAWTIAGVASYVTSGTGTMGICGLEGRPSVFNRIDVKVSWIQRMINKYS